MSALQKPRSTEANMPGYEQPALDWLDGRPAESLEHCGATTYNKDVNWSLSPVPARPGPEAGKPSIEANPGDSVENDGMRWDQRL